MDAVKDEQNRAREVGRSARGGHVSGTKGKSLYNESTQFNPFLGGRGAPTRGNVILLSLYHLTGIHLRSRTRWSSTWWAWAGAGSVTVSVQLSAFSLLFNALHFHIIDTDHGPVKDHPVRQGAPQLHRLRVCRSNNHQSA